MAGAVLAAAAIFRRGVGIERRLGLSRRTTPGNRYREFALGSRPLYLREDAFEAGALSQVRVKGRGRS